MNRTMREIVKVGLAGVLSLYILSLFTFIYSYTGIHVYNPSGATDYKWSKNQFKSTMIEGFSWLYMDANGFNNHMRNKQTDILLMGSSHMEAINVSSNENVGYLLNQYFSDIATYNIGVSGHDIYRCVKNLKNAVQEYKPSSYLIIETDTAVLSADKIQQVLDDKMQVIPSYDSGIMYLLQRYCPAIKNIYKQIQAWHRVDAKTEDNETNCSPPKELLDSFAKKIRKDCGENIKLIVLYQPSFQLDSNGSIAFDESKDAVLKFKQACEDNDIYFLDMTDQFSSMYNNNFILPRGFINTKVGIGHLNKYGHLAIANSLIDVIRNDL